MPPRSRVRKDTSSSGSAIVPQLTNLAKIYGHPAKYGVLKKFPGELKSGLTPSFVAANSPKKQNSDRKDLDISQRLRFRGDLSHAWNSILEVILIPFKTLQQQNYKLWTPLRRYTRETMRYG